MLKVGSEKICKQNLGTTRRFAIELFGDVAYCEVYWIGGLVTE